MPLCMHAQASRMPSPHRACSCTASVARGPLIRRLMGLQPCRYCTMNTDKQRNRCEIQEEVRPGAPLNLSFKEGAWALAL